MTWLIGLADLPAMSITPGDEMLRGELGHLPVLVGRSFCGGVAKHVLSQQLIEVEAYVLTSRMMSISTLEQLSCWHLQISYFNVPSMESKPNQSLRCQQR